MALNGARVTRAWSRQTAKLLALFVLAGLAGQAAAQNQGGQGFVNRAVGGVLIDPDGILRNAEVDAQQQLAQARAKAMQDVPGELNEPAELRKVSLRQLEAALSDCLDRGDPIPDEILYLAGLQRIRYVFVYPEQSDIVLAGFGEGWTVDGRGNVVGRTTGQPVLMLGDLLVALRTAHDASQGGISCSIDPTAAGLKRLQALVSNLGRDPVDPRAAAKAIEEQMGPQTITVTGVPDTSHFARVLVAADYRMKRLAMGLDPSPVAGLPSYMSMVKGGKAGVREVMPRWWLTTHYDPLLTDGNGLAWELRGAGVKAMAEDDLLASDGTRTRTGRASPMIQKWADSMTAKYEELSAKDPIFGELRNCMDLAVIAALVVKEDLAAKAGYSMPLLMSWSDLPVDEFHAPKQVATIASIVSRRKDYVLSASGGVMVHSWGVADLKQASDTLAPRHAEAAQARTDRWWWN